MKRKDAQSGELIGAVLVGLFCAATAWAQATKPAAPERIDARLPYVHRIQLYDDQGKLIRAADREPYAPMQTCGTCHETSRISCGWHFNAADPDARRGRPGEPWILVDPTTRTQLPLSYRAWPNRWRPEDAGVNQWSFVLAFGRHLPGGYPTTRAADGSIAKPKPRWGPSGEFQIDCMACHDASGTYDLEARSHQIKQENFRWAPTIALGLGHVGPAQSARNVDEESFKRDSLASEDFDGPRLSYDRSRFDAEGRVLLNITRRVSNERCYGCHTVSHVSAGAPERWQRDADVHLRAGLSCVDCHRHGLDHRTVRGHEAEQPAMGLSCRGCHYGDAQAPSVETRLGGRLRAPRPVHKGLPTIHLEKISCTACHSGSWPADAPEAVHTSMAHALGTKSRYRGQATPPYISEPLFLRGEDGKIAPHRAVWPSFWAQERDGRFAPLAMDRVRAAAKDILPVERSVETARLDPLSGEQVAAVLAKLQAAGVGAPALISAGKVYRAADGKLAGSDSPQAAPYTWTLAHDVRPAAQSLGARSCEDCHEEEGAVFFARVTPTSLAKIEPAAARAMHELRGESPTLWKVWALSFDGRTLFVIVCAAALAVLGATVLLHAFRGLSWLCGIRPAESAVAPASRRWNLLVGWATLVGAAGLAATGLTAFVGWGGPMSGWLLIAHCLFAPLFALGSAAGVILWAMERWCCAGQRALFWLTSIGATLVVATAVLGFLKWCGTDGLRLLYEVHRYSAAALVVLAAVLLLSMMRGGNRESAIGNQQSA